jgi:hypothetical protein
MNLVFDSLSVRLVHVLMGSIPPVSYAFLYSPFDNLVEV